MNFADTKSQGLYSERPPLVPVPPEDPEKARNKALAGSPDDRARFVERIRIAVPQYTECVELADELIHRCGALNAPGGMLVLGEGGEGKTSLATKLVEMYPAENTLYHRSIPVLCISLVDSPSVSALRERIYAALGQSKVPHSTDPQKSPDQLLAEALYACNVRLLIWDEAQTIWVMTASRRNSGRLAGPLGEFIRNLYDVSHIPMMFLANPSLRELFNRDKQTFTRWPTVRSLESPSFGAAYIGRMTAWDEALPMPSISGLGEESIASRIYEYTKGNFRLDRKFLAFCVREAAQKDIDSLTPEVLNRGLYLTFGINTNLFGAKPQPGAA